MEIQKNISATMRKKLCEYRNQAEFADALDVGHTTFRECLSGRGNPSADTIELLARGMGITPGQLVSGESTPADSAFDLINGMLEGLTPALCEPGAILLNALRELFRLSERRRAEELRWSYAVIEPHPFQYALRPRRRGEQGGEVEAAESQPFTDDRHVAEAAAELFTRNSLSPIHLPEAIEDYMKMI